MRMSGHPCFYEGRKLKSRGGMETGMLKDVGISEVIGKEQSLTSQKMSPGKI